MPASAEQPAPLPHDIGSIEWFASAQDLCHAFTGLAALQAEPGLNPISTVLSANNGGVGLSATTKLAPARIAGLMMGLWFLSISVGDYIGGRLASVYESFPLPELFGIVAAFCIVAGLLLVFLLRPMKTLMGGVN